VIGGGHEIEQRSAFALTAARLPGVEIKTFTIERMALPDLDASPRAWHEAIAVPPEPVHQFILLIDPFSFPAEDLLAGLDFAYPESVKIGGLASAAQRPGGNALYLDSETHASGAVGVALSGDIAVDTVVAQGCRPIGKPMQITKAERNYILQLDGRSPIQVVRELIMSLPEEDRTLARNSLFIGILQNELTSDPERSDYLIRNILGMEPEHGALAIGELLREGQLIQFHLRDARTAAEDVSHLLGRFAAQERSHAARGALLFSCLGRGMFLYGHPDHDTDMFKEKVGDLPVGGFFCSGEIGPVGGTTRLHGYTSSFGIFRSAAARGG
jgi:small ligand-binding sensory domain FIST